MTDKEFQAMLNGKKIKWGGAEKANEALKKKPNLPNDNSKQEVKKQKDNH